MHQGRQDASLPGDHCAFSTEHRVRSSLHSLSASGPFRSFSTCRSHTTNGPRRMLMMPLSHAPLRGAPNPLCTAGRPQLAPLFAWAQP